MTYLLQHRRGLRPPGTGHLQSANQREDLEKDQTAFAQPIHRHAIEPGQVRWGATETDLLGLDANAEKQSRS